MNDIFKLYWSDNTLSYKIDYGNAKISTNKVAKISFKDSLIYFEEYYKNYKNIKEKLINFFIDFESCDEFEILYLNASGKEFVNFRKNFDDIKDDKLSSFVIVGKKNEYIVENWNSNSAAIFFDVEFKDNNNTRSKDWIKFRLVRIEFLDLSYIKKNIDKIKIEFKEDNLDSINLFENNYVTDVFSNTKKSINIFDKLSNEKLKINEWYDLIHKISLGNESKDKNIQIIPTENLSFESDLKKIKNILVSAKFDISNNRNNKLILLNPKDENIKFNLELFDVIKIKDPSEYLKEKYIKNLNNNFVSLNEDIDTNKKKIDEIETKIDENNNEIEKLNLEKSKNNLKVKELNWKKDEILKQKDSFLKKIIDQKDVSLIKSLEEEILNLKETIKSIDDDLNSCQDKLNTINRQINSYESNKKTLEEKNKDLKNENIKNKQGLEEIVKKLEYFNFLIDYIENKQLFSVTLNFQDENIYQLNISIPLFPLSKELFDKELWEISFDDIGLIRKFKRYYNSMENIKRGIYKNPYIIKSIIEPSLIKTYEEIPLEIQEKYKLNTNQLKSVKGAISTNDNFYLQGPPGTGKTQTICAITECVISKNKNVLMTSSTHEAINNYFDRLDEFTKKNPNVILLKQDSLAKDKTKNKINDYSFEKMFYRFFEKSKNYVSDLGEFNDLDEIKKEFNELYKEINDHDIFYFPEDYLNLIKNNFNNNSMNDIQKEIIDQFQKWTNDNNLEFNFELLEKFISQLKGKIEDSILLKYKNKPLFYRLENLIKKISNFSNVWDFNPLKNIYEFLNRKKSDNLSLFKNHFKNYFEKNIKDNVYNENSFSFKEISNEFIKYAFNEKTCVNVIGMTTTSRTDFSFEGTSKDLFFDYPIDTVIIDEISKSSTPEILARIILAKKSICCGDYKQLPPSSDLETSDIERYFSDKNDDEKKEKQKEIDKLYKESFFNHQVQKLKNYAHDQNNYNKTYQFLNVQHRFNKEIMDVVNCFYDNEEELAMPPIIENNHINSEEIKFAFFDGIDSENMNNISSENVILIDTSKLYQSFINEYCKKHLNILNKISNLDYSFDQQKELINKNLNIKKATGKVNEQNAFLIVKSIKKFIDLNKDKIDNIASKIGVICLSINQKHIIISLIKEMIDDLEIRNKLKIDTIDNFQGREKEFIFVDFVRSKYDFDNLSKKVKNRNLSFISSNERINVAISRAKSKLFLFGSFSYYKENEDNNYNEIKHISTRFIEKISNKIGM